MTELDRPLTVKTNTGSNVEMHPERQPATPPDAAVRRVPRAVPLKNAAMLTPEGRLNLDDRLALRPREAARALGLSERTLRQILPQIPHLRAGSAVLIPVDTLREWLRERAESGKSRVDGIADEVLASLKGGHGNT